MYILLSLLLSGARLGAATSSYPAQAVSAVGVARIEIAGVRGALKLRGTSSPRYRLKVRHTTLRRDDWGLSVERRGDTLAIEVFNTALGREWKPLLAKDQWPVFDVELEGPARPVVIGWRDGRVDVDDWSAAVDASLLSGTLRVRRAGAVNARVAAGDVVVEDQAGALDVRGGNGTLRLARVSGPSKLNWFSGASDWRDVRGALAFEGEHGDLRSVRGDGTWDVRLGDGRIDVTDFGGRLRGTGRSAAWRVHGTPSVDIAITSERGAVTVVEPRAARVSLGSRLGRIGAPWAQILRDGVRVAEGRLGATVARKLARVFVRTDSGPVRLVH